MWGTGKLCEEVLNDGDWNGLVGFIQTIPKDKVFRSLPVYSPNEIPENIDIIIVATYYSDEIYNECLKNSLSLEIVVFLEKGSKTEFCEIQSIKRIIGEKRYTKYVSDYGRVDRSFFMDDMREYEKTNRRASFEIKKKYLYPIITDKYEPAGCINSYFYQDLWGAQKVISSGVCDHYDIGSRIDGFIAHLLSAGIKVHIIDVREFPAQIDNLETIVADATKMECFADESIHSLSALCSLEHFGLGRYGDPVNSEACFEAFNSIQKKVQKGGNVYISVPIGKERVEFNAHRVFYAETIVNSFHQMDLIDFSCCRNEEFFRELDIHQYDDEDRDSSIFGLFHFRKR